MSLHSLGSSGSTPILPRMRRLLSVLLVLMFSFQMPWALAADYCVHERGIGTASREDATHFGHHEHAHAVAETVDDGVDGSGMEHPDCGVCHLGCAKLPAPQAHVALPAHLDTGHRLAAEPAVASHAGQRIERPKWTRAA